MVGYGTWLGVGHSVGVLLFPKFPTPGPIEPLITLATMMTIIIDPARISRYSNDVCPR
jgi:hypothetical protein